MALEKLAGSLTVAARNGIEDPAMFLIRNQQSAAVRKPVATIDAQLIAKRPVEHCESRIAGGVVKKRMEVEIQRNIPVCVPFLRRGVEIFENLTECVKLRHIDVCCRFFSSQPGEARAYVE